MRKLPHNKTFWNFWGQLVPSGLCYHLLCEDTYSLAWHEHIGRVRAEAHVLSVSSVTRKLLRCHQRGGPVQQQRRRRPTGAGSGQAAPVHQWPPAPAPATPSFLRSADQDPAITITSPCPAPPGRWAGLWGFPGPVLTPG